MLAVQREKLKQIFVYDEDRSFLDGLSDGLPADVRLLKFSDRITAQLALANAKYKISAIVVNSISTDGASLSIIRFCKINRKDVPTFLLLEEAVDEKIKEEYKNFSISGFFRKPLNGKSLNELIYPSSRDNRSESDNVIDISAGDMGYFDDAEMHPIEAKGFICGKTAPFNLFVRLGSGKFIMILKTGDEMDQNRVNSYLSKGIQYFYLRKCDQELYLRYCERLVEVFLKKE